MPLCRKAKGYTPGVNEKIMLLNRLKENNMENGGKKEEDKNDGNRNKNMWTRFFRKSCLLLDAVWLCHLLESTFLLQTDHLFSQQPPHI